MIQRSIIVGTALLLHFPTHAGAADAPVVSATNTAAAATTNLVVAGSNSPIATAAAVVDGHIISMEDVTLKCVREYRSPIVNQMLQHYILDRECKRRGITVEAEVDKRIAQWRTNLAPATLEDALQKTHFTVAEAREGIRFEIEKPLLVADQTKSLRMVHGRELVVTFDSSHGESNALALAMDLRRQILEGADFATMVAKHSGGANKEKNGDMGVLCERVLRPVEAPVLDAALGLKPGEVSSPIKASDGYHLIKAESTADHHPPAESAFYAEATRYEQGFLVPEAMSALIDKCKITFVDDSELVPGKPLPEVAAVVDGHPILMKDVVDKCVAMNGPKVAHVLVQNYVVDRECEKRGITVKETEIEERVEALRKQCAPMTLEEGMKMHHTTMAGLRYDFRQEIERTQLVISQVKPRHMVHLCIILARMNAVSESDTGRADRDAKAQIIAIQEQIKAGKRFEDLAAQYCVPEDPGKSGDMGVVFPNKPDLDTDIVNAAIAMKKGEISSTPIKAYSGYALLQAISDSDNHSSDEDAAYAKALYGYRSLEAQRLVPQTIAGLIKKSNVAYYVHS